MLKCKKCNITSEPDKKEKVFSNGTVHTEACCSRCGAFIKYLSHQEPKDTPIYFGKYEGKTLGWIKKEDPEYLRWLYDKSKPAMKEKIDEVLSN